MLGLRSKKHLYYYFNQTSENTHFWNDCNIFPCEFSFVFLFQSLSHISHLQHQQLTPVVYSQEYRWVREQHTYWQEWDWHTYWQEWASMQTREDTAIVFCSLKKRRCGSRSESESERFHGGVGLNQNQKGFMVGLVWIGIRKVSWWGWSESQESTTPHLVCNSSPLHTSSWSVNICVVFH